VVQQMSEQFISPPHADVFGTVLNTGAAGLNPTRGNGTHITILCRVLCGHDPTPSYTLLLLLLLLLFYSAAALSRVLAFFK
jgi:hypothetical protein